MEHCSNCAKLDSAYRARGVELSALQQRIERLEKDVIIAKADTQAAETATKLYSTHIALIHKAIGDEGFKKIQDSVWEFVNQNGKELPK